MADFKEPYNDIITVPCFNFHFESENAGDDGGETQIFEYLKTEKNLFKEIKKQYLKVQVLQHDFNFQCVKR